MTTEEFYEQFAKILAADPDAIVVLSSAEACTIRLLAGGHVHCPLTYVAWCVLGALYASKDLLRAGAHLGLEREDTQRLATAADRNAVETAAVRQRFFDAVDEHIVRTGRVATIRQRGPGEGEQGATL